MADAPDSKSGTRKGVWVQVPPPVLLSDKDLGQISAFAGAPEFGTPARPSALNLPHLADC